MGLDFLHLGVSYSYFWGLFFYVWWLVILKFGGYIFYVWVLVILTFGG